MVKDVLNHIINNMIGSAKTSHKILEDGDVPIFPVVLITPKSFWYSHSRSGSHYTSLAWILIQSVYGRIFDSRVRQLFVLAVSWFQDEWLKKVLRHYIEWTVVVVVVMARKEKNLAVPWCFPWLGSEIVGVIQIDASVHITRRCCVYHPVPMDTIVQVLYEGELLVNHYRIYKAMVIIPIED